MAEHKIQTEQINQVGQYLVQRPYAEVKALVEMLASLPVVQPEKPKEETKP